LKDQDQAQEERKGLKERCEDFSSWQVHSLINQSKSFKWVSRMVLGEITSPWRGAGPPKSGMDKQGAWKADMEVVI